MYRKPYIFWFWWFFMGNDDVVFKSLNRFEIFAKAIMQKFSKLEVNVFSENYRSSGPSVFVDRVFSIPGGKLIQDDCQYDSDAEFREEFYLTCLSNLKTAMGKGYIIKYVSGEGTGPYKFEVTNEVSSD